jgi:hypothetical protein
VKVVEVEPSLVAMAEHVPVLVMAADGAMAEEAHAVEVVLQHVLVVVMLVLVRVVLFAAFSVFSRKYWTHKTVTDNYLENIVYSGTNYIGPAKLVKISISNSTYICFKFRRKYVEQ